MAEKEIPAKNMHEWLLHQAYGKEIAVFVSGPIDAQGSNGTTGTVTWVGADAFTIKGEDAIVPYEFMIPFSHVISVVILIKDK